MFTIPQITLTITLSQRMF